ncbi:MAG: SGNH/GDSL hydrolase family protein [Bdellovibrionales bacterium]|nr:SGNH/GDSL hydrolase family protein [Bdellovibrionales bacterium]
MEYDSELGFKVRSKVWGSNEFGFNDNHAVKKEPDVFRIIILGDSFNWYGGTACNYPALIEKSLNDVPDFKKNKIEVINMGYPMTGTREQYLLLKRHLLQYNPDLVLLGFFVGNDFRDAVLDRKRIVLNAAFIDIDPRHIVEVFGYPIVPRSRAYVLLTHMSTIRKNTELGWDANIGVCDFAPGPTMTEDAFSKVAFENLQWGHKNFSIDQMQEQYKNVSETIYLMKHYLKKQNIDFKVLILPDELQVDESVFNEELAKTQFSKEDIDIELSRKKIKEILSTENIEYLDLFPMFKKIGSDKRLYILRDTHFNKDGTELAASEITKWLVPQLNSYSLGK